MLLFNSAVKANIEYYSWDIIGTEESQSREEQRGSVHLQTR